MLTFGLRCYLRVNHVLVLLCVYVWLEGNENSFSIIFGYLAQFKYDILTF